jgi:hypothetical protein
VAKNQSRTTLNILSYIHGERRSMTRCRTSMKSHLDPLVVFLLSKSWLLGDGSDLAQCGSRRLDMSNTARFGCPAFSLGLSTCLSKSVQFVSVCSQINPKVGGFWIFCFVASHFGCIPPRLKGEICS